MEYKYIEFISLLVDIAINKENKSSLGICSKEYFHKNCEDKIKFSNINGMFIYEKRFDHNMNISPGALSGMASRLYQAIHVDKYINEWFLHVCKIKITKPAAEKASVVKQKSFEILEYVVEHDCLNHDHFQNDDGQINELICLEIQYATELLKRHNIKYSFGENNNVNECVEKQQQENDKQLYDRLKKEGKDDIEITRALIENNPKITNFRLGFLVQPVAGPDEKLSPTQAECQRGRGRRLRAAAFPRAKKISNSYKK